MKERPILFNCEMVRAILEGRKTQTRRSIKWPKEYQVDNAAMERIAARNDPFALRRCPYGLPGDRLWIRETFAIVPKTAYAMSEGVQQTIRPNDNHDAAIFRAGWERSTGGLRWRPSIHMPRWASRITLEITNVRIELLQDISESDAAAEGFDLPPAEGQSFKFKALHNFKFTWNQIYKNWDQNPWVWVIEFKRIQEAA